MKNLNQIRGLADKARDAGAQPKAQADKPFDTYWQGVEDALRWVDDNHVPELQALIEADARRRITLASSVEQCKAEVLEMLAGPILTSRGTETVTADDISGFGDLHDYCDANMLGSLCDEDNEVVFVDEQGEIDKATDEGNDRWMKFGNDLQEAIASWIKEGGHRK